MTKVFLSYGCSEGPRHGALMLKALQKAGFEIAKNISEANIIIAHSGGAYVLSLDQIHSMLLIIGPPYWAGKKFLKSFIQNLRHSYKLFVAERSRHVWLHKMAWHGIYALTQPLSTYRMWRGWFNRREWWAKLNQSSKKTIVIRNINDPFCGPDISSILTNNIVFKKMPGFHDDIWINPKPYVELLK